ncbi:MAG TPA: hypothetical protein VGX28_15220 [Frankiaceae bacterium]|jgi:hypothetical protein|nr:hypothetical protein [Frankiaceae bacterium]
MRTLPVLALAVTLSACGGAAKAPVATAPPPTTAAPTTASATPTPTLAPLAVVKAAVAATRAKGTASFSVEATTSFQYGHFTMLREGAYDLRNDRIRVTQTFDAKPKELVNQLMGEDVDIDSLAVHSIAIGNEGYLQMPAWPASIRSKWLRITHKDVASSTGMNVEVQRFPAAVEMLSAATATNVPTFGNTYYVDVTAPVAILAAPGLSSVKVLRDAGVDLDALTGTVQVAVEVTGGLVTRVTFDAIEAYRQAWTKAGQGQLAGVVRSVETIVTLTDHGKPVSIEAPTAVMTDREFETAT